MAFLTENLIGAGITTLSGDTSIDGALSVAGSQNLSGTTNIYENLNVSGEVDFNGTLDVHSNFNVYSTANIGAIEFQNDSVDDGATGFNVKDPYTGSYLHSVSGDIPVGTGNILVRRGIIVTGSTFGVSIAGSSGTSGVGESGSSGTSGENGTSGSSGTGENGTSGSSGSGESGSSGTSGETDGTSGTSGETGYVTTGLTYVNDVFNIIGDLTINGESVVSGSSGTSGDEGTSGTSGETDGTSGSSGSSGTSGDSGSSGTSGEDGTSGESGTSGDSGTIYTGVTYSDEKLSVYTKLDVNGHPITGSYELSITVSPYSERFKTLVDTLTWLETNMSGNTSILLTADEEEINETITIDLPYNLAIKGGAYDQNKFIPGSGLGNSPMFELKSNTSFTKIVMDAIGTGFGSNPDEDGILVSVDDLYIELKDFMIRGFYRNVYSTSNSEFWVMDGVLNCATKSGFELNTTSDGAKYRSTLMDYSCFITTNNDYVGINLISGNTIYLSSEQDTSELSTTGQTFIKKPDDTSTTFKDLVILSTIWNKTGSFSSGFDYTRADGRDADVEVISCIGVEDNKPHAKVNVIGNSGATEMNQTTFVKVNYTTSSTYMKKFSFIDNNLTFLPSHPRTLSMFISGALTTSTSQSNVIFSIVKNGDTGTTYGNMNIFLDQNARAFNFSTNVYIEDVEQNDYFGIYAKNTGTNDQIILQDVNWLILSQ